MDTAKIEIDFRLVTLKIHKSNATKNSQVIIKVSTQNTKKQNKPIDWFVHSSGNWRRWR